MDCYPGSNKHCAYAEQKDRDGPRPAMVCVCVSSSEMPEIHVKLESLLGQKNTQDRSMAELSGILLMKMIITTA